MASVLFEPLKRCRQSSWLAGVVCLGLLLLLGPLAIAEPEISEAIPDTVDWTKERQFWAFQSPQPQPRPRINNRRWPRQPIDYFILARLEQKQLTPSPEADKWTLLRRAYFDITGLPPTQEEARAFLADKRPDAYERLIDKLLASPRFGERMASLWLPLARYAEDQAHQVGSDTKAFYPNAFRYREWVIDAFNEDLPYDEFLKMQLAADLIVPAQTNQMAALGFIGLGPKYYNRNRLDVQATEWEDRVDTVTRAMLGLTVACARCHDHKFDPITTRDYYAMAGVFASIKMVNKPAGGNSISNDVSADKMGAEIMHLIEEGEAKDLNVFMRGNVDRKGPLAERRFLRVLSAGDPVLYKEGSGRKQLAEDIANPSNPLTARVMVNRVWDFYFARALVASPSNFGHSGQLPSHPELLDDLAARFMAGGWSVKELIREITLSATYRQSSVSDPRKAKVDAANDLYWRMNRKRLSIEQWRDAVLFVAGNIDWSGGKSLELDDPANLKRTVYARISRLKLNDLLMLFDYPDANVHAERRSNTITPMQKLFVLNSPFMLSQARILAARLTAAEKLPEKAKIENAYQELFSRAPHQKELQVALAFLSQPGEGVPRWEQYAQMLLACNEMMYVD